MDAPSAALTLNHSGLMAEAACAGLGIAFVAESWAREALDDGRLEIVREAWSPPVEGLQLHHPRQRHTPAALRAFVAVLREVQAG